ncbi:hypothetical protein AVEN_262194-1, partial [Araneus ventricosus]
MAVRTPALVLETFQRLSFKVPEFFGRIVVASFVVIFTYFHDCHFLECYCDEWYSTGGRLLLHDISVPGPRVRWCGRNTLLPSHDAGGLHVPGRSRRDIS